jgi:type I restriction enzyme S subunit
VTVESDGKIPDNWGTAALGELCEPPQYGWTTRAEYKNNGVKLLRSTDISSGSIDWTTVPFCETPPPETSKYQLHSGDIVITRTGAGVGNSFLIQRIPVSVFASYLIRFRPDANVNPKYVHYFLKSPAYWSAISSNSAGIAQPNVNAKKLASIEVPLAPRKSQDAIVAEIEKQFTRLDAAVAALKRVQANLKRYRASVLKAACGGRLVPTEAELARREGRSYEPSSALLERIFAERKVQLHLNLNGTLQSPVPRGAHTPDGWLWVSLGDVLHEIQAGRSFKCDERPPSKNELGLVKVSAVTWGDFDELESKTCTDSSKFEREFLIRKGDLLFSRANTIELVGACVIVGDFNLRLMLSDKILRLKVASSVPKQWVLHWLRSRFGRSEIERLSTGNQNSMRNIGQDRIKSIRIALPPLSETERIIAELERRFSVVDGIQAQIDLDLKRAQSLKQSILMRAFEGKLVLQDPNDEPASALLERIRGTAIPGCAPGRADKVTRRAAAAKETVNA